MEDCLASKVNGRLKVICVGIGDASCNVVSQIFDKKLSGIDVIVINTNSKSLASIENVLKIQIGSKLVKGLGSGMKPTIGRECALENYDEIQTALSGADLVLICTCLGGGTGSGAGPVIANIAKKVASLTVSIVTMPFVFEGRKRGKIAKEGLKEINKESDSVIVIQNDKILPNINRNLGIKNIFKFVDCVIKEAITGLFGLLPLKEKNDIKLDFYDFKTIMNHKGMSLMGVGEHNGENAAYKAIEKSIKYALLENISLSKATGILIHFNIHTDFPIMAVAEAMEIIYACTDNDAEIIFGITTDTSLSVDYVKATIILTGLEKNNMPANNTQYER